MKTTVQIDDKTLHKASRMTGIKEKNSLIQRGLEALISLESSRQLARLGGSEKSLRLVPRKRNGHR